ncbi:hypothetical protein MMC25_002081 [Agyrium rufum]|nr:hypothetical protein [Agyrium rufum]
MDRPLLTSCRVEQKEIPENLKKALKAAVEESYTLQEFVDRALNASNLSGAGCGPYWFAALQDLQEEIDEDKQLYEEDAKDEKDNGKASLSRKRTKQRWIYYYKGNSLGSLHIKESYQHRMPFINVKWLGKWSIICDGVDSSFFEEPHQEIHGKSML